MQTETPDISERSLQAFLDGDDKVLVIKGEWGVGKTFWWESFVRSSIEQKKLKQVAYSYVSLFGRSGLTDAKSAVFQAGKAVAAPQAIQQQFDRDTEASSSLLDLVPWVRQAKETGVRLLPRVKFLSLAARSNPFTDRYPTQIAAAEYRLVRNYLVCFDDLERKGAGLSAREVMGLADELARRKGCKVVLISTKTR